MWNRLVIGGLVVTALAVAPAAEAGLITGSMSISSQPGGAGLNAVLPIGAGGTVLVNFTGATALDFTTTGVKSAGPGLFQVDATAGDFSSLWSLVGNIYDFSFSGPGQAGYPAPPLSSFQVISSPSFSFDLTSVSVFSQSANSLTLNGFGWFHLAGFDATPGTAVFTANEAGDTFSFSASETTVPEPASMLLFGTGLVGLATAIRRRVKK